MTEKHMTGFYIKHNIAMKWVNLWFADGEKMRSYVEISNTKVFFKEQQNDSFALKEMLNTG